MTKFSNFQDYMSDEKCIQASAFLNDNDQLLQFIVATYNDYVNLHSEANLSVITNPDALFRTKESEDAFLFEFKQYIRDVVGLPPMEDVQNAKQHPKNRNNRGNTNTVNQ